MILSKKQIGQFQNYSNNVLVHNNLDILLDSRFIIFLYRFLLKLKPTIFAMKTSTREFTIFTKLPATIII